MSTPKTVTIVLLMLVVAGLALRKTTFFPRFGGAVSGVYRVNGNA